MNVGVCSWSLRPESARQLVENIQRVGVSCVQLALSPIVRGAMPIDAVTAAFDGTGIEIVSGMMEMAGEDYSTLESIRLTGGVRADDRWLENRDAATRVAETCRRLDLDLVTFHAGFIPHDSANRDGDARALCRVMVDRLVEISAIFAEHGVRVAFETGQERADTLLDVLGAFPADQVGVNFDPANMLLYDMGDPIAALDALASRVFQIHIKDARRTKTAGEWGTEVPVGDGEVDWLAFFATIARNELDVDLMVEREAGEQRVDDMQRAVEVVTQSLGGRR